MNGFEPLRRRIINYTEAGQWSEVYDGPLEDCESEKLKAENAKLRELLQDLAICACGKYCYGCPHQYDGCNRDQRLRELGIEVDG